MVPNYVPDIAYNFACFFATNAFISVKDYFQALYLRFYLQKK